MTTGSSPEDLGGSVAAETASAHADATSSNQDAAQPQQAADTADANTSTANSSGADKQDAKTEEPKSLLDAVRRVVDPKTAQTGKPSTPEGKEGAKPEGDKPDANADGTQPAEPEEPPFHTHPRWKELKAERDTLKTERDRYKGDAEDFQHIVGFMAKNRLTPDEVSQGFNVMSALKHSPADALKVLGPIVDDLRRLNGDVLPQDLQERVDAGYVDEQTARELAKARGQNAVTQKRQEEDAALARQEAEQGARVEHARACADAVRQWESGIKGKDADYAKKAVAVERYARALMAERGQPRTAEEAVRIVHDAYESVNQTFRSALPPRPRVIPPPSSAGSSNAAAPVPQTLSDVVRLAATRR